MKLELVNFRQAVRFQPNSRSGAMAAEVGNEGVVSLEYDEDLEMVAIHVQNKRGKRTKLVPRENCADMDPSAGMQAATQAKRTRRVSSKPTDD